jgi:hypothetical protein
MVLKFLIGLACDSDEVAAGFGVVLQHGEFRRDGGDVFLGDADRALTITVSKAKPVNGPAATDLTPQKPLPREQLQFMIGQPDAAKRR